MLYNRGKIPLDYNIINGSGEDDCLPGRLSVSPTDKGKIPPYSSSTFIVKYYPGVPDRFNKQFQIQVAHFEPDTIEVVGSGVFPRLKLSLPRFGDQSGVYAGFLAEAHECLRRDTLNSSSSSKSNDSLEFPSEEEVEIEAERLMVRQFAENTRAITQEGGSRKKKAK